ncbi:MAG: hypothetical protein J6J86_08580, partial [Lachnospiraceae bacterium]|nr:hypothetical protein [Lachnospiraceae bacterium]
MRPDTPQRYEYITVEDIDGRINSFININPWTQFYDLKDRKDIPLSYADHITLRNCNCECDIYFKVQACEEQYILSNFELENLNIKAKENRFSEDMIRDVSVKNVVVTIEK